MIKKVGSKFRVVSEHGAKNLGESGTKAGAVKRLRQVEWFKQHAKCVVDPTLVKDRQYMPVVFNTRDAALPKNEREVDFPSTAQAYDLKDIKQPEFPSTPFTGEAYTQSFWNPTAGQGNDPDIQKKGSDFTPAHATNNPNYAADRNKTSKAHAQGQSAVDSRTGEKTSAGRGGAADPLVVSRAAITPGLEQGMGGGTHINPIRQAIDNRIKRHGGGPKTLRQVALSNTAAGAAVSDFSRSIKIEGNKMIFKNHPNEFRYPVDKGDDSKTFGDQHYTLAVDPEEEAAKRKALFRAQKLRDAQRKLTEAGDFDAYLGRSLKIELNKGKVQIYTQNQPLDPKYKPVAEIENADEKPQKGSLKIVTFSPKHVGKSIKKALDTMGRYRKPAGIGGFGPPMPPVKGPDPYRWVDPEKRKEVEELNPHMKKEKKEEGTEKSKTPLEAGRKQMKYLKNSLERNLDAFRIENQPSHPNVVLRRHSEATAKKFGEKEAEKGLRRAAGEAIIEHREKERAEKSFANRPNAIEGGIGDKLEPKDVNENELEAGIQIEQEHVGRNIDATDDEKRIAGQDIALDHLAEDPEYYTHLAEMERKAKQQNKDKTTAKKILAMAKKAVRFTLKKTVVSLADYKQHRRNMGKPAGKDLPPLREFKGKDAEGNPTTYYFEHQADVKPFRKKDK